MELLLLLVGGLRAAWEPLLSAGRSRMLLISCLHS